MDIRVHKSTRVSHVGTRAAPQAAASSAARHRSSPFCGQPGWRASRETARVRQVMNGAGAPFSPEVPGCQVGRSVEGELKALQLGLADEGEWREEMGKGKRA